MKITLTIQSFIEKGLSPTHANQLVEQLNTVSKECASADLAWARISREILPAYSSFDIHLIIYSSLFPTWHTHPETSPAWLPTEELVTSANISQLMQSLNLSTLSDFHQWSTSHPALYWELMTKKLSIQFATPPQTTVDLTNRIESPNWFPGAKMNIAASCFQADPKQPAIFYTDANDTIQHWTYGELDNLTNQIANSLIQQGYTAGDAIAIAMPMNQFAIAIYLGIIKMGGVVVSVADSFSADEIATRLVIANAKAIFTQDAVPWGEKQIPLYPKVKQACIIASRSHSVKVISLPYQQSTPEDKRDEDLVWTDFLDTKTSFTAYTTDPMSPCNILFSSGTTGTPKAIVWNHTTPIKAGADAHLHQNIKASDILAWPTNLGWMMGPWLIFAAFLNRAAIAVYCGSPKDRAFGEFIQNAHVTMLGVVPTLVAAWRQSKCMENLDWRQIKLFSSTGECSNAEDMLYLMSLANYKPVIEYCGGTEIGGAYITSTVIQPNHPSLFSTKAMGSDFIVLDENNHAATIGEVAIIPPSIGLSTTLLNADHHQTYFADMPLSPSKQILRRHGDQIKVHSNGYYSILGRVDDTMKLGGIKISAAEIERTITGIDEIIEVAAIAIPPVTQGPARLVIYAATASQLPKETVMKKMQQKINAELNPLFKIFDLVFIKELPKTASNKIMRRVLRSQYLTSQESNSAT